jgi:hypothetical protein
LLILNIFLVEKSGNVSSDGTLEIKDEERLEDILEPSSSPAWSDVSEPSSTALDDGNGSKGPEERMAAVSDAETEDAGKSEENLRHVPDEQNKETEVPSENEGKNAAVSIPDEKKESGDENFGTDPTNG